MSTREFLLVNQSERVTTAQAKQMAAAVATQVKKHFAPAWGILPVPVRVGTEKSARDGTFVVLMQDDPDDPGALGYHTESGDKEYAKIFVAPVLDNGGVVLLDKDNTQNSSVASVLSHEVLELLADPYCNSWVEGPPSKAGSLYSLEVCDPVEADQYVVSGVAVSNFVIPEWFNPDTTRKDQYDYVGKLSAPFTMTPGGYMVVRSAGQGDGKEIFAKHRAPWRTKAKLANARSRANRRREWQSIAK